DSRPNPHFRKCAGHMDLTGCVTSIGMGTDARERAPSSWPEAYPILFCLSGFIRGAAPRAPLPSLTKNISENAQYVTLQSYVSDHEIFRSCSDHRSPAIPRQ